MYLSLYTRNIKEDVVKPNKMSIEYVNEPDVLKDKAFQEKVVRRKNEKKKTQLRKQQRQRKKDKYYA